jgi:uncharacterized protein with von Willebrand factor type A (vWA) domain
MASADISPGPLLRRRLAGFAASLRDSGFVVGLAETQDALRLLAGNASVWRASLLRPALKSLFCSRLSDWQRFDEIFDAFWLGRGTRRLVTAGAGGAAARQTSAQQLAGTHVPSETPRIINRDLAPNDVEIGDGRGRREGASSAELLTHTDFRHLSNAADIAAAHALAQRFALALRRRLTRRQRAHRRGRRLDLRKTIHRNIGHGGEPIELVFKRRKEKPLRLVVMLDASGSMSLYAPFFIRFMHGLLGAFREAEGFVFHTRLIHVSPALRERDAGRAIDRLALIAQGIGGGTRIGESLAAFNRWHAKRVLHARSAVMILSDGYETGRPEDLAAEMRALRRRCRRIAWLNPMLGWEGYTPAARGMAAALPYVDLFAPAHDLASLAALEPFLARL